jgi:histone demethylase JARID1
MEANMHKKFPTKRQKVHTLQEGQGFDDGQTYTLAEYKTMADSFARHWAKMHHNTDDQSSLSQAQLAKDYWDIVETGCKQAIVDYGNDLDTSTFMSGFPKEKANKISKAASLRLDQNAEEFYKQSGWNLNNLPTAEGSILKYLATPVNGVNVPWLYIGMLFASFCWHNEDNFFYSVSYGHFGATKQWYGVPGDEAEKFEKVLSF